MARNQTLILTLCPWQAAMALLANEDLDLERYLHQLMPPALTCCVARRLGAAPADDHWVRSYFSLGIYGTLLQLMPVALTCCVACRLGAAPADDHWARYRVRLQGFLLPCSSSCRPC